MKKWSFIWLVMISFSAATAQDKKADMWNELAKTKFESKFNETLQEYIFYPTFSAQLKAMEGKEITIEGYYVPFAPEESNYVILSKFPQSQCFFCGGAGPESIVEVNFKKDSHTFQVDDLITVRGKLKLNADNMDHVNFILNDAVVVSK